MTPSLLTQSSSLSAQATYANALQAQASSKAAAAGLNPDKAKAAAQSFEGFFVGQMMEYMSEGLKADGVTGGGSAEDTWRSMLNQEYGKQIAKSGGLGISNWVMKGMLQAQEKNASAKAASQSSSANGSGAAPDSNSTPDSAQAAIVTGTLTRGKSVLA